MNTYENKCIDAAKYWWQIFMSYICPWNWLDEGEVQFMLFRKHPLK